VTRASSPSLVRALPVESTRTSAESVGGSFTMASPGDTTPWEGTDRSFRRSPPLGATLGELLGPALEGSQSGAVKLSGCRPQAPNFSQTSRKTGYFR
jgi:hypothetical protein